MRQSAERFLNFTQFLHVGGLSLYGTKLHHGLLVVDHGTVPLRAHSNVLLDHGVLAL